APPRDAIATTRNILVSSGSAIVVVDPIARSELRRFDTSTLPPLGRLAIAGNRLVIGTDSSAVVVASIDGSGPALPPLARVVSGCDEVVSLPSTMPPSTMPRVAVLCRGTGLDPQSRRPTAGLFWLEVPASGMPQLLGSIVAFDRDVPSDSLVALTETEVAM